MSIGKRSHLAALLLCGASALTLSTLNPAAATPLADKPAGSVAPSSPADSVTKGVGETTVEAPGVPSNDAGAKTIAEFLGNYLGADVLPSVKITPDGDGYRVAFDLGKGVTAMKSAGVAYDTATLVFKVKQQPDGQWKADLDGMPPLVAHIDPPSGPNAPPKMDARVENTNLKYFLTIDPKMNWISDSHGSADKLSIVEHGPGVDENIELNGVKFDGTTTNGPAGLTHTIHEPIDSFGFTMDADPKGVDGATGKPAQPVHVSAQGQKGAAEVVLKDFQPEPLLAALRYFANHDSRAAMAKDADGLKSVIAGLAGDHMRLDENVRLEKFDVLSKIGTVTIEGAGFDIGMVNGGTETGISERFVAKAIKLPDGLVPPMYASLVPTSFDIGFKASGFDLDAASKEYIADMNLDGDGPPLSPENQTKFAEKLMKGRPIVIDIPLSHIHGPLVDIAFEGKVTVEGNAPTGEITVTMRDFDKTAEAVQGLGPQAAQATPVIAMAKGFGKAGPDGSLVWVCSLGADKVMKVNGMPLGKAPF